MATKRVVLCADDYAQDEAISEGILLLASAGKISAISCMSAARNWSAAAEGLRSLQADVDIGLHFTLLREAFIDPNAPAISKERDAGVGALILSAYLGRLDRSLIRDALNRQLDCFAEGLGRLPDFIDGHQHIHQFPVIRDIFLDVCESRFQGEDFYVRSLQLISGMRYSRVKSRIIRALGARSFTRELDQRGLRHNREFCGIYDFNTSRYREQMQHWLQEVSDGTLFMCHPAKAGQGEADEIRQARRQEFVYLNSREFDEDRERLDIRLVRGSEAGWTAT